MYAMSAMWLLRFVALLHNFDLWTSAGLELCFNWAQLRLPPSRETSFSAHLMADKVRGLSHSSAMLLFSSRTTIDLLAMKWPTSMCVIFSVSMTVSNWFAHWPFALIRVVGSC
jgi:hypothetical protein